MRKETVDTSRDWKPWFAWHPIRVHLDGNRYIWVFLEKVQRRILPCYEGVRIEIRNLDGSSLDEKA